MAGLLQFSPPTDSLSNPFGAGALPRHSPPRDTPTNPFGAGALPFSNVSSPGNPFGPTRLPNKLSLLPEGLYQDSPKSMDVDQTMVTPMPPGGLRFTPPRASEPAESLNNP
ncbi:hypothetical protein RSAG8_06188, partial [Rhizoctonia solani AG-8 WAC10335]